MPRLPGSPRSTAYPGRNMLLLTRPPHAGHGSPNFLGIEALRALTYWIRVALKHDQRGGTRRICCCEKRGCRKRGTLRDEDHFSTSEIIEHRTNAVGPSTPTSGARQV